MIFDLGFHKGDDTAFYLKKGYNVVAVEANPLLVEKGLERFLKYHYMEQLVIINKAVTFNTDIVNFYIHPTHSNWSSCDKKYAERDGTTSKYISIETISLVKLCEEYGTPHYLKVDIEGRELYVAEQLNLLKDKPRYVSFETGRSNYAKIILRLFIAGYRKFQLRNQLNNDEYTSGDFGEDLPPSKWISCEETLIRYKMYADLKDKDDKELALGWLDVHASL